MKKTVKSLIIAASVAAIAGIGAVSFAAWNASDVDSVTAPGSTATILTNKGEIVVSDNNLSDTVKLVPYDQVAQVGSNAKMQTFKVKYDGSAEGAAPVASYTYSMELTTGTSLPLYYKIGTVSGEVTKPTEEGVTVPDGWTLFDEAVDLDLASGEQTVNIILISDDYEADGKTAYVITISAEAL